MTLREGAGRAGATDVTVREGISTGAGQMNLVPGALFLRYTLLAPLEVTSGEADLWFIRHNQTEYVLKLYRYGIEPKAVMTQKLQALAAQHVVKLEEHGKFGNRAYEVLEKIEHGDLRKLAKPVAAEQLKEVLRELSEAVSHLHTEGILHRDLKPGNVLMRSREPLDLVLTDFGISSLNEGTMHLTNANRTASYSAPEALTGVVSAASDWWSVGVMVLELLKGVHPFAGKSEQVINFQLVSKGIVIPADTAAEWAELLKGLLTRDHEKRWQGEQVAKWLTGVRNQPTHYEGDRQQTHTHKPYQFGGKDIYTAKELAVALSEDWANGAKNFGRGFVSGWVDRQLENHDLASRLLDVQEDKELSPDEKLSSALVEMDRSLPGMWKGAIINREWAAREQKEFQALLQSRVRPKLERQPGWPVELIEKLTALKAAKISPEHLAALERVAITGNPQLKVGDWEVTAETLAQHPDRAVTVLESQLPALYQQLTEQAWLMEAAERWVKYWPRVESLGCGTRAEKALPWIIGSPQALRKQAGVIAAQYVGAKNEALNRLWHAGAIWGAAECVAVCAAASSELVTGLAKAAAERVAAAKTLAEKVAAAGAAALAEAAAQAKVARAKVAAAEAAAVAEAAAQAQAQAIYMAKSLAYLQGFGVQMDWELAVELIKRPDVHATLALENLRNQISIDVVEELRANPRLGKIYGRVTGEILDTIACWAAAAHLEEAASVKKKQTEMESEGRVLTGASTQIAFAALGRAFQQFGLEGIVFYQAELAVTGESGADFLSYGQHVIGTVIATETGSEVMIKSSPTNQWFDWGRGKREAREIAEILGRILATEPIR